MRAERSNPALRPLDCFVTPCLAMTAERTAIVTGAGKRVGAAIATALIDDGWTVLAHVHHEADDVPEGTTKVVADLADRDCAERIFAAAATMSPVRLQRRCARRNRDPR